MKFQRPLSAKVAFMISGYAKKAKVLSEKKRRSERIPAIKDCKKFTRRRYSRKKERGKSPCQKKTKSTTAPFPRCEFLWSMQYGG